MIVSTNKSKMVSAGDGSRLSQTPTFCFRRQEDVRRLPVLGRCTTLFFLLNVLFYFLIYLQVSSNTSLGDVILDELFLTKNESKLS